MTRARRFVSSLTVVVVLGLVLTACGSPDMTAPTCDEAGRDTLVLMAQSVPSATMVPCIEALPSGWFVNAVEIKSGGTRMTFGDDETGTGTHLEVDLAAACSITSAVPVPSDEEGADRFEDVARVRNGFTGTRHYVFDGGCVTYRFDVSGDGWSTTVNDASLALTFHPRAALDAYVRDRTGGAVERLPRESPVR